MRQSRQYRQWTPDERAMLAMLWQTVMPAHEIAEILDRTETSMQQQAYFMGVKRPIKRPHRPKDWTREEDSHLVTQRLAGAKFTEIVIGDRTPMQMKNRMAYLRRTRPERLAFSIAWTPDCDSKLVELSEPSRRLGWKDISQQMGISVAAILRRAKSLGVRKRRPKWTEEETAYLHAAYSEGIRVSQIAATIPRPPRAIASHARKLGLKMVRNPGTTWTPIETAPKDGTRFLARAAGRGIRRRVVWWENGWTSLIHFQKWVWIPEEWKEIKP